MTVSKSLLVRSGFEALQIFQQGLSSSICLGVIYEHIYLPQYTCQLEKSHKVWTVMMIAASLMWAEAVEKHDQPRVALKRLKIIQNNSVGSE